MWLLQSESARPRFPGSQLTRPRLREENLVAREKKALSKANRTKGIKVTLPKLPSAPSMPKLGRKFSVKKNKVTGLTDVPVAAPQLDIQALPVDESYYLSPIGDSHYIDGAFSESNEDIAGLATPNTYFEYSSSTSSLPSDYEAALSSASPVAPYQYSRSYKALDYSIAAGSSAGPVHNFRDPHRTSNTTIPGYVQSATDQSHIVHQSYMFASDCAQSSPMSYPSMSNESPSGLCLYIPGSPARTASPAVGIIPSFPYGHTRSYSTPLSPAVSQTPSPRVYQGGPIDWSARPLAPFAISSTSTVSQTVRMDEICKVSL